MSVAGKWAWEWWEMWEVWEAWDVDSAMNRRPWPDANVYGRTFPGHPFASLRYVPGYDLIGVLTGHHVDNQGVSRGLDYYGFKFTKKITETFTASAGY